MGAASPSLAEALASPATDLGLQGSPGRTASRLRNVSMRVPDRSCASPCQPVLLLISRAPNSVTPDNANQKICTLDQKLIIAW